MLALQNDHLNENSEQEVFETLATWLKGQAEPLSEDEHIKYLAACASRSSRKTS